MVSEKRIPVFGISIYGGNMGHVGGSSPEVLSNLLREKFRLLPPVRIEVPVRARKVRAYCDRTFQDFEVLKSELVGGGVHPSWDGVELRARKVGCVVRWYAYHPQVIPARLWESTFSRI